MPELFSQRSLPDGLPEWITDRQSVIEYNIEPSSEISDFLALSFGIGKSRSGVSKAEQKVIGRAPPLH